MERKWGKTILCLMLYTIHARVEKSAKNECACHAKPHSAAQWNTTHRTHSSLLTRHDCTPENHTHINQRERDRKQEERRPIRSTQLRFVSHTKRRRCATVIFMTLKHWDKLALCKISEPGLMEAPRGSMESNLRRHGDKQNARACFDSHRWIA